MELRPNAAPRRDSSIVPAPPPSERWFLRVQGVTLGPFALEDVRAGIQSGEFEAADKICSSGEPGWKTLAEHPRFALPSAPALSLKSGNIPSPPPPRVLRVKAPPTPAVAPEPAAAEVAAPISEPPPAPAVVEAPPEAPAAPAAMAHATIISAEPIPAPVAEPAMPLATPSETISPSSAIPSRPDYTPIFIAAPDSWKETKKNSAKDRTIKIELKLPEKPLKRGIWKALASQIPPAPH